MDKRAIGVFDSGLGGLNAVKELKEILPNENIIYFGDTGRVPYGSKSNETIRRFALQDANFLLSNDVKLIVAACGTVSSVVEDLGDSIPVSYISVVKPACFEAKRSTKNGKIGIIGTKATIETHSYKKRLEEKNPEFTVYEKACPLFVPLVESGRTDKDDIVVKEIVKEYLSPLKEKGIDTLILGCTHYPLLSDAIKNELGENVTLVNAGKEAALYAKKVLAENDLLNECNDYGFSKFYVSDTPQSFAELASRFLGNSIENQVEKIDIEEY